MQANSRSRQYVANHDGAAILDIKRGTITTLNSTGAFVLQGLDSGQTMEAIVAALAETTGHDASALAEDVDAFVEALKRQQILL